MRKRFVGYALLLLAAGVAQAAPTSAKVSRTDGAVTLTVDNGSETDLKCDGRVYGETRKGKVLRESVRNVIVEPGRYFQVVLYTESGKDPFVRGWSDVNCRPPEPPKAPPSEPQPPPEE